MRPSMTLASPSNRCVAVPVAPAGPMSRTVVATASSNGRYSASPASFPASAAPRAAAICAPVRATDQSRTSSIRPSNGLMLPWPCG